MRLVVLGAILVALSAQAAAVSGDPRPSPREEAVRFEEGKGIAQPVLVKKVPPVYPADARKEKVTGIVVVDATIGTDGKILKAEAVEGDDARLRQAAEDAVRQWEYKPVTDAAGRPVQVVFRVTVNFQLR